MTRAHARFVVGAIGVCIVGGCVWVGMVVQSVGLPEWARICASAATVLGWGAQFAVPLAHALQALTIDDE